MPLWTWHSSWPYTGVVVALVVAVVERDVVCVVVCDEVAVVVGLNVGDVLLLEVAVVVMVVVVVGVELGVLVAVVVALEVGVPVGPGAVAGRQRKVAAAVRKRTQGTAGTAGTDLWPVCMRARVCVLDNGTAVRGGAPPAGMRKQASRPAKAAAQHRHSLRWHSANVPSTNEASAKFSITAAALHSLSTWITSPIVHEKDAANPPLQRRCRCACTCVSERAPQTRPLFSSIKVRCTSPHIVTSKGCSYIKAQASI